MSKRGTCIGNVADCNYPGCQSINNTFLFSERPHDPESCFHCVRIFVRTVNIIEKQECKCHFFIISCVKKNFCAQILLAMHKVYMYIVHIFEMESCLYSEI